MNVQALGSNDDFQVSVEDVNIADPGAGLTLFIHRKNSGTSKEIQLAIDLIEDGLPINIYSSTVIFNSPSAQGETYCAIVVPFADPSYEAGRSFRLEMEVSFPKDSSLESFRVNYDQPIESLGGRLDYMDIPYFLIPGDILYPGQYFRAQNNEFYALMTYLGDFCMYKGLNPSTGGTLLNSSKTSNLKESLSLVYQENGNICLKPTEEVIRGLPAEPVKCAFSTIPEGAMNATLYIGSAGDLIMQLPDGDLLNLTKNSDLFK